MEMKNKNVDIFVFSFRSNHYPGISVRSIYGYKRKEIYFIYSMIHLMVQKAFEVAC